MPRAKKPAAKSKATKKAASKAPSKSKFIREQPASMNAKDVVAKGKEAGLTFTEKYVWNIRAGMKMAAKKAKPAAAAKAMPAEKPAAAKAKPGEKVTKTQYVLSFPPGTPAADVVAAGKAKGITLSTAHVYSIRSGAKGKASGKVAKTAAEAQAVKVVSKAAFRAAPRSGSLEDQFVAIVLDIGLARASELLGRLKDRVQGLAL